MLHFNTIKKIMQKQTQIPIESRAVYDIIAFLENTVEEITKLSVKELRKYNLARESQGLPPKLRISSDCVGGAIKTIIMGQTDVNLPSRAGGMKQEHGKSDESKQKHRTHKGVEVA